MTGSGVPRTTTATTRPRRARHPGRSFAAAVLIAVVVVPAWWLLVAAFETPGSPPPRSVAWWPADPTLGNVSAAFDAVPLGRSLLVSLLVSVVAVPLAVWVASWAGFAIARLGGRATVVLAGVCLVAAMVPVPSLAVGRLMLFRWLGVTDSPVPLIAPALLGMSPLFVLLYAWSFHRLPPAVYDLAREAGLSPPATWWRVAMPLVPATTTAVATLAFVLSWGDLLGPLFFVHDARWFTVPIQLRSLATLPATERPVMLAGTLVAMLPALAALVGLRRWLERDEGTR